MMKSSSACFFCAFAISIFFLLTFCLVPESVFILLYCLPCLSGLSLVFSVQMNAVLVCVHALMFAVQSEQRRKQNEVKISGFDSRHLSNVQC